MKILIMLVCVFMLTDIVGNNTCIAIPPEWQIIQEVTTTTRLEPDTVYYVPNPPLLVHGAGVNFIVPSTSVIVLANKWDYGVVICDGAVITSGYPKPVIADPNDYYFSPDVTEPAWIIGEDPNVPFFHNQVGLFIARDAGSGSIVNNLIITGSHYGFVVDKELDYPVTNLNTIGCYNGIYSCGSNTFLNCTVSYYGIWSPEWQYYGQGITGDNMDWDMTMYLPDTSFKFMNCLVNDGEDAYTVYGHTDPNFIPEFIVYDSVATNNYSAFNGWDGFVLYDIQSPGLYNNVRDRNFGGLPLTNPVYDSNDPFDVSSDYRLKLKPSSTFVDGSQTFPVAQGWTTTEDDKPDKGLGDIWPHYPRKKSSRWLTADFNEDYIVDPNDFILFMQNWLEENSIVADLDSNGNIGIGDLLILGENWLGSGLGDIDGDGIVNYFDFSIVQGFWTNAATDPVSIDVNNDRIVNYADFAALSSQWMFQGITPKFVRSTSLDEVDILNIKGRVGLRLMDMPFFVDMVSVYVADVRVGGWMRSNDTTDPAVYFDSEYFDNGWNPVTITLTSLSTGFTTNQKTMMVYFNNMIYRVRADDTFRPEEDYRYTGFLAKNGSVIVTLTGFGGAPLWTGTADGPYLDITVPGSAFASEQLCDFEITENAAAQNSAKLFAASSSSSSSAKKTKKALKKKFKKGDMDDRQIRMVIIMPNPDVYRARAWPIRECAQACIDQGIDWIPLYNHDVTWDNIRHIYNQNSIKFIYWVGHANSHVGSDPENGILGVARTNTQCWYDSSNWWNPISSYDLELVLSYTQYTVGGASELPNNWDDRGRDLAWLGMDESHGKKIVFVDGCLSAYYGDMAWAYGSTSVADHGFQEQVYIGWRTTVKVSGGIAEWFLGTNQAIATFWQGMGDGKTVYDAFYFVQTSHGATVRQSIFGRQGIFKDMPDNDQITFHGLGLHNARLEG